MRPFRLPLNQRRRLLTTTLALVCGVFCWPADAGAHGVRLPFAEWGGFAPATLHCQRELARAAATCADTVWALRRACRERALQGGPPCDAAADPRRVAARSRALDAAEDACSERQFADVGFLGFLDVQVDLTTFCYGWADTAEALAFAPLGGDPVDAACATAAADAASAAARHVFRARRRAMDRAAGQAAASADRGALLTGVEHGKAAAAQRLAAHLTTRCPDFAARYARTPTEFASLLLARADCIGGAFYIQSSVLCPAPVCGNHLIEPPETCDDGNTADGDTCPSDCMR